MNAANSDAQLEAELNLTPEPWSVEKNTAESPTDAYGLINFQGGSYSCKAKYVRLSHDSKADAILQLMLKEWQMELPKLVISVHGGMQKFELHPRIKQLLSKGLIKAAVTTGAWIFTGGINTGVAKHVGDALNEQASRLSSKICTIGIAPWGVVENRKDLIGRNGVAPYQTLLKPLSKLSVLNKVHSHFILVDDGTVGRYGAEVNVRRELEKTINLQQIHARIGQGVPVVALILEGGPSVILTVLEYLQQSPPVPVVVCEGTGRAGDILASLHKQTEEGGNLPEGAEHAVIATIKNTFNFSQKEAVHLFHTLMECMKKKRLITVFHLGSTKNQDIDVAILTARLKGMNASTLDQLILTLAWDRVDIAKNHVFVYGQQWMVGALEQAMLDALVMDRVSFVKLLIENGVSMHRFLTIPRLEELYNTKQGPTNPTLFHLLHDVKKGNLPPGYKITLIDVGLVIDFLMGGTYRCSYTRKRFRTIYKIVTQRSSENALHNANQNGENHSTFYNRDVKKERQRHNHFIQTAQPYKSKVDITEKENNVQRTRMDFNADDPETRLFPYPFNELLVWAVLMKRQKMALLFWQHGEELMAKALVARKLYRTMSYEAKQSEVIDDTSEELKEYSNEFGDLAVELLDQSYRQNETMAMKLLMYELKNWSKYTCLKLAVASRHRTFVVHTCTQMLLSDMWMGRLNMRKNSWFKVIFSILVPPTIFLLEYKTKAEMSHIPQSHEAHQMTMNSNDSEIPAEAILKEGGDSKVRETMNGINGNHKKLSIRQKWHDFYHAPIVKFWFNTLTYFGFLMLYSYVVLVEMENEPSVQEWIVIVYIFTSAIEKIREMLTSEAGHIKQKIKVWFCDFLHMSDAVAIVTFFIGFGMRFRTQHLSAELDNIGSSVFIAGRLTYCLNIIFWYVRLMDLLNINQQAGPYVLMIGRMVKNMFPVVVIMGIIITGYGVPRQAILYPHEEPSWSFARNIFFEPYWMMYGEMFAYEIDVCANNSVMPQLCGPGTWITPILQAVYCFIQYIIMVNLLIAFFNNVYLQGKAISDVLWKYQRYHSIMAQLEKPVLPPPLIILSYLSSIASCLCRRKKKVTSHKPKLFLTEEDQKKLHDFEVHCAETYFDEKSKKSQSASEHRIKVTFERVEEIATQVKEVGDQVGYIKHSLQSLDAHIGHLQDLSALTLDTMKTLMAQKASEASTIHKVISREMNISDNSGPSMVGDGLLMSSKNRNSIGNLFEFSCQGGHNTKNKNFLTVPSWSAYHCTVGPDFDARSARGSGYCRKGNSSSSASLSSSKFHTEPRVRSPSAKLSESPTENQTRSVSADSVSISVPKVTFFISVPSEPTFKGHRNCEDTNTETCISKVAPDCLTVESTTVKRIESKLLLPDDSLSTADPSSSCQILTKMGVGSGGHVNLGFIDDEDDCIDNGINGHMNQPGTFDHQLSINSRKRKKSALQSYDQTVMSTQTPPGGLFKDMGIKEESFDCTVAPVEGEQGKAINGTIVKGLLQQLWTKYKSSGDGAQKMSIDKTKPADTGESLKTGYRMRQAKSLTSVSEFRPKYLPELSHSQAASPEDFDNQVDSKAALLMDLRHSRSYSGNSKKRPEDERFNNPVSAFKPNMDITFYYSAVERNNLMRLSQNIPFTPVPPRGELVTVYRLEESSPSILNNSMSSWSQEGLSAKIECISKEEMGGGLRRAVMVLCTWSEYDILKTGKLYIIKSFLPEVVNTWSGIYQGDTVLQLCLREIQQQRAAQKLVCAFNLMKPKSIAYSPRFLEVFLMYCHSAGQWFTVEECITGRFRKYNNNNGDESAPASILEQTMLAFSHWTYEYTRGELLVLDLQGVGESLTDPSVIKAGENRSYDMVFGPANLGEDAIKNFRSKHCCNSCCRKLKLPDLKRNEYLPVGETLTKDECSSVSFQSGNYVTNSLQPVHVVL